MRDMVPMYGFGGSSLKKDDLADAWISGKNYAVGDYCISENQLYKCKTEHTAGSAFSADYWDSVSVAAELQGKVDTQKFAYRMFPSGAKFVIRFTKLSVPAIIFGTAGRDSGGILITYGNGDIGRISIPSTVSVISPSPSDGYLTVVIKNESGPYGCIGVICLGDSKVTIDAA